MFKKQKPYTRGMLEYSGNADTFPPKGTPSISTDTESLESAIQLSLFICIKRTSVFSLCLSFSLSLKLLRQWCFSPWLIYISKSLFFLSPSPSPSLNLHNSWITRSSGTESPTLDPKWVTSGPYERFGV